MDYKNFTEHGEISVINESLELNVPDVALRGVTVHGDICIMADNVTVENCIADSITVKANGAVCQGNKVSGKIIVDVSENVLIAQNDAMDIEGDGAVNCSVILNETTSINMIHGVNIYVIDNIVDGELYLYNLNKISRRLYSRNPRSPK